MSVTDWVIVAVVIAAVIIALLGLDRYRGSRKKGDSSTSAQPTEEVFADPETGRRTRVWYDPLTGERQYRPE
jgi:hypothetical protein